MYLLFFSIALYLYTCCTLLPMYVPFWQGRVFVWYMKINFMSYAIITPLPCSTSLYPPSLYCYHYHRSTQHPDVPPSQGNVWAGNYYSM